MASLETFRKILGKYRSAYLDTNILIYHLEDVSPYSNLTMVLFDSIESSRISGHTASLSLLELNVKPYQINLPHRALAHFALLKNLPHFSMHPLTAEMADTAARMRAKYSLKTPDAIHVACAVDTHCQAMICNDKALKKVTEVDCLILDQFIR